MQDSWRKTAPNLKEIEKQTKECDLLREQQLEKVKVAEDKYHRILAEFSIKNVSQFFSADVRQKNDMLRNVMEASIESNIIKVVSISGRSYEFDLKNPPEWFVHREMLSEIAARQAARAKEDPDYHQELEKQIGILAQDVKNSLELIFESGLQHSSKSSV